MAGTPMVTCSFGADCKAQGTRCPRGFDKLYRIRSFFQFSSLQMLGNGEELKKEKCVVEFDSGERCDGKSSQYRGREKILRKITIAFKIGPDTKKDRINLSGCVKTISPSPDKELKFLARTSDTVHHNRHFMFMGGIN